MKTTGSFKRLSGLLHLWLGLASGIVVFVVSITGCLFVFEEEIRNITQKEFRFVEPQNRPKLSLAQATAIVTQRFPDQKIEQIRLFSAADRTIIARLVDKNAVSRKKPGKEDEDEYEGMKMVVSLNPYTGAVLGPWNMDQDFLHMVEKMHKTLLLGEVGKWIIKVNIVIFLVMLISGLVLWFPRKKNQVKTAFTLKFDAKWQRINYDFHNVLGFYFVFPLLLITLTGIWWAIKPSQKLVYAVLGDTKKEMKKPVSVVQPGRAFSPVQAFETVAPHHPGWNEAHINFAKHSKDVVKVNLRYPYEVVKKQNVFEFDQYSGKLLKSELFNDYSAADNVKHANRDLHTGQAFGLFGKILMFLASLFSATLPWSGFLIWYQKKYKKPVVRPRRVPVPASQEVKRKPVYQPRVPVKA